MMQNNYICPKTTCSISCILRSYLLANLVEEYVHHPNLLHCKNTAFLQCNNHYTILLDESDIKNFSFCGLNEGHQQCSYLQ